MRSSKNIKGAFLLSIVMLAVVILVSCQDAVESQWINAGIRQVRVLQLYMAETIASGDTLTIILIGDSLPYDRLSLDRIDAVRETTEIGLTVWAKVEKLIGSREVQPNNFLNCTYQAQPPFNIGQFRVVIQQPDGSQLVKNVLVGP